MNEQIRTWNHSRKGRIVGVVVNENPEWITVRLTEQTSSEDVDERLTFRRLLAKEVVT